MMKKTLILIVAGLFLGIGALMELSYAQETSKLTRIELAECLCKRQGINLPPENLSKDDYYNAIANALAAKGVNIFQNSKPSDAITCAQAVDMLYDIAGGKENLDTAAKIDFLVKNGYLSTAADPAKVASTCEQILCQPPVEPFTAAPEPLRTQAPNVTQENPASQGGGVQ
ncbi:MAG: hypothetical protein PHQ57_00490 [Candidatus Omnitrophica bacterium]|nr:hypothetical protein [Candidatus Omnitrophota bacterium]